MYRKSLCVDICHTTDVEEYNHGFIGEEYIKY